MALEKTNELYRLLLSKGYPKEFCAEIAYKNMNTDYTATRMLGYLYRVTDPRIEDLVDEMLAILSDRDAIIQKKEMEQAQAFLNDIYNNGLSTQDREMYQEHKEGSGEVQNERITAVYRGSEKKV